MYTPETEAKIQFWRQKAAEGTLTKEDMKEAIVALRQGRVSAAHASEKSRATKASGTTTSRTAKTKTSVDVDDLLGELGDL